jgi:hypothetical protein
MNNLNESFNDFIFEAQTRTPEQVDAEKRDVIKLAKQAAKDLIKSNPVKAGYYKAKIRYLEAKLTTLDAYKKMLNSK